MSQIFKEFRNKRILIIGDMIVDQYIIGTASRISPDAPVPLIDVSNEQNLPGSLQIVMEKILRLGGDVDVISCVGNDFEGQTILKQISDLNVGIKGIIQIPTPTPKITRIKANNQQLIRLEKRYIFSNQQIQEINARFVELLADRIEKCDAILILDYDLGLLNSILISQILTLSHEANKPVIVRPEDQKYYLYRDVALITMNQTIASKATGIPPINDTSFRIMGTKIQNQVNAKGVYIPWIEGDSYIFQPNEIEKIPSLLKFPGKYIGNIGPTIHAILALMLALQKSPLDAIKMAHFAASIAAMTKIPEDIKNQIDFVIKNGTLPVQ
jgi:D-beta-D-heptose 7-phosphate kinase/D-beta-D-heptose 1-phosphate adenosyltransferase